MSVESVHNRTDALVITVYDELWGKRILSQCGASAKSAFLVRLEVANALDNSRDLVRPLVPGNGFFLYAWRIYPRSLDRGCGHPGIQSDSGSKANGLAAKANKMKPIVWIGILSIVGGEGGSCLPEVFLHAFGRKFLM